MIAQRKDGRDLIVVGQKSGITWALDPDNKGALVWSRKIGSGGANGGIHWGTATDGTRVYVSLNDRGPNDRGPNAEAQRSAGRPAGTPDTSDTAETFGTPGPPRAPGTPGLFALDLETGSIVWERKSEGDCTGDRKQRFAACDTRLGYSPAPLVVDGAVVQGAIDGILRVFDAASGKTLWTYDTMRKFDTVNGVPGNGGSIDSSPYVAANGMLFSVSGYSRFGESPGNVLLAFKPKK
ncbi:MAG TPA: PQQ-binding-like beta-propeller repeat protein, partial [Steroidobacteraceae bacterium]|nr:PQQ-binding-like beta-propeller repeat protein [Steroidobacteraceae bacterium]